EQGVPDSKKDDAAQVNTAAITVSTASTIPVKKRRKHFAAKKAEDKRNRPSRKAQQRSIINSKRVGDKLEQESIKKQKVDEDKETAELKSLMEVIPDEEEVAVDAIPLATKPPSIIDWKIHKEGKKSYY
ncbi:hypothetical protein Tco_1435948, partial [Tanacetum coccineum]